MQNHIFAYIYLLQDGGDKGSNIFKVGRTVQSQDTRKLARIQTYNKGTVVYNIFHVEHCYLYEVEKEIKKLFRQKYRLARGLEWFEGNVRDMKKDIDKLLDDCKYQSPGIITRQRARKIQ